ncbi:NUDIX hydrolase [Mesorhizobium sp. ANAO-SY3R2]|uniref:NUDIX hydrolase n=1 Tax=Mesorhizobium sp. ANAO-SY3R2 TaxID=3166644 RepID=UPI003671D1E7
MTDLMSGARSANTAADGGVLQQYGALPWRVGRRGKLEVVLITSRTRGRWILPKGWLAKGRTPAQSAAREAFEEAGVVGQPDSMPIGSYRYMKQRADGTVEPCDVTLFSLQVHGTLLNWPERHQRQRCRRPLHEAVDLIAEPELAQLLRSLQHNLQAFG